MRAKYSIGFVGGGNMAASLIGGLIHDGFEPERISVLDVDPARLDHLGGRFGIRTTTDSAALLEASDVLVLAVKPQVVETACAGLREALGERRPLVVSIAAGVRIDALRGWLGPGVPVIRCMPNTPALVRAGATALYAGSDVTAADRDVAESLLRAVGLTLWVHDESDLDAVTAISGSGPAYFFLLMELMEDAAVSMGLERQTARLLVQQTALGAGRIAIEVNEAPARLREQVTSPGGTTERALAVFEEGGLRELVARALAAARERSAALSQQWGD